MQPDVKRIGDALGLGRRINQENWIEQAQVLAKGGETYYATRRARGEAASAAPTPDEGERRPAGSGAASALPAVSERAAFARGQAPAYAPTSATAPTVLAESLAADCAIHAADACCGRADSPGGAGGARRSACASAASMPRSRSC